MTTMIKTTSTNIVERRFPARLRKSHKFPSLRNKHRVYDEVQNNQPILEKMDVLITKYIEDIGNPGEVVSLRNTLARQFLLTKHAVYPSEENLAKYNVQKDSEDNYSSKYVKTTLNRFAAFSLTITMNKDNPWTLEPWHVRNAFQKAHVIVPESAITMPKQQIKGPDLSLEKKEFFITLTINKKEQCYIRCRIFHWTSNQDERLPFVKYPWKFPREPLSAEDEEIAAKLPAIVPPEVDEDGELIIEKKRIAKRL